jgi:hypothetical protein
MASKPAMDLLAELKDGSPPTVYIFFFTLK